MGEGNFSALQPRQRNHDLPRKCSNIKAIGYAPDARVLQVDFLMEPKSLFFCSPASGAIALLLFPPLGDF